MHNYYLMVAVEQGMIGLVIFLVLLVGVLLYGEQTYHKMEAGTKKQFLMAGVDFILLQSCLSLPSMIPWRRISWGRSFS